MARCYWAVLGYGIKVKEEMFNEDKLRGFLNLEEDEDVWDNYYLQDLFEEIIPKNYYLEFVSTGNSDLGEYLMYFSNNPWFMSEDEKSLTREDVENMLIEVLLPYLEDEFTAEWILQNAEDISVGGEG